MAVELLTLCKDICALLHITSLVDWTKHAKVFFHAFVLAGSAVQDLRQTFTAVWAKPLHDKFLAPAIGVLRRSVKREGKLTSFGYLVSKVVPLNTL